MSDPEEEWAEYSSETDSDLDTDDEIRKAFSEGALNGLKKGLVRPIAPKQSCTNDVAGLRHKLEELCTKKLDWLERMDVHLPKPAKKEKLTKKSKSGQVRSLNPGEEDEESLNVNDDFKREMNFMSHAQANVTAGLEKLSAFGVPTLRPNDYFAEMVKTDDHMRLVRERLLSKKKRIEAAEKARKMRELKKVGKKVQQEVMEERRKERKSNMAAVKKFSRGKGEKPKFLKHPGDEDEFPTSVQDERQQKRQQTNVFGKSKRRQNKDQKYGVGKKRGYKRNTAESTSDMSSFQPPKSGSGLKSRGGGFGTKSRGKMVSKGGSGKTKRLGKGRREKIKLAGRRK